MANVPKLGILVAAALVLVLVLTLEASPAAGDSRRACRVTNTDSGKSYTALQAAVDAAKSGARLTIRGTCVGNTVVAKDLTLAGVNSRLNGEPRLSGGLHARVLTIEKSAVVELRDVEIRGGSSRSGGGIHNRGKLTLTDVLVSRNRCRLSDHVAVGRGGGILNRGTIRANGSTRISRNWCDAGASGVTNMGTFVMNGSSTIVRNHGVYGTGVNNWGTFVMNGSSSIDGNNSSDSTGGVNNGGTFVMNDASTIRANAGGTAWGGDGGVYNAESGTFTMNDTSSIRDNEGDVSGDGGSGGVQNLGTFTMRDSSSISGNTALCSQSGVTVRGGTFTMTGDSVITANVAQYLAGWCEWTGGAGIYHQGGTLVGVSCAPQTYANVYGNTPDDCYIE